MNTELSAQDLIDKLERLHIQSDQISKEDPAEPNFQHYDNSPSGRLHQRSSHFRAHQEPKRTETGRQGQDQ